MNVAAKRVTCLLLAACLLGVLLAAGCRSSDPMAFDADMLGTRNEAIVGIHFGLLVTLLSDIQWETVPLSDDYEAPFGRYAVLTAHDGIVVALIASIPKGNNVELHMLMDARDLAEFRSFEARWPFADNDLSVTERFMERQHARSLDDNATRKYGPRPKDDEEWWKYRIPPGFEPIGAYPVNILPSGVGEDNWRLISGRLAGWPFKGAPEPPVATVGGRAISWKELDDGLAKGTVRGVVDITGRLPKDRFPGLRPKWEAPSEPAEKVKP